MRPHHARIVNSMTVETIDFVLWYFDLRPVREKGWLPSISLAEMGIGQADVVLALLRSNEKLFLMEAERLVGSRILRCPPCLRPLAPSHRNDLSHRFGDDRRITKVIPSNPRHKGWNCHYRFEIFKAGMTISQFLTRGGTRRDVRQALRRGWIQLEGDIA